MEDLKMKYHKKRKTVVGFVLIAVVALVFNTLFVSALSIGFGSAVNIEPGQSLDKSFLIMNQGQDSQNTVVEIKIEEGSQYVSFSKGTRYEIPAGKAVEAIATFKAPNGAKPGDVYPARITFNTVEGGASAGGGTIEFKVGQSVSFDINIYDKVPTTAPLKEEQKTPEQPQKSLGSTVLLWVLVALIVLVIVVWLIFRKKRN